MTIPSVGERRAWLDQRFATWKTLTLHGALDRAADEFPERPFIITDDRSWTYREVVDWSHRLAQGLLQSGAESGDKIAILLANFPEFVPLKFAISRIGAVAVPINILNRRDEIRYLLEQSDSALLVTMDRFRDNDYLAALDEIAPGWAEQGGGTALPLLRKVVVFETGEAPRRQGTFSFDDLDVTTAGADNEVPVDPSSLCDLVYTSGTTGPPKGVMLTHDMLTRTSFGSAYGRAFEDGRRIIFSLPMFHVFGYVEGLLAAMWVGGAIIPQLRFDPDTTLSAIATHRATDALLIPAMSLALIDAARERAFDLSSLCFALASGGRAPERVWQALRDELGIDEITTGYGMTEVTASGTVTRPDDPFQRLLTTNGRPRDVGSAGDPDLDGRLIVYQVRDLVTDTVLPPGEIGELVARGAGVFKGYYRNPEATSAAFTADGWLKTGDLGRIDGDGYVSLAGRSKESYRCGGEQVLPTEIEDLLTSHPDVLQAHVVPVLDERMGEVGVALVVPRPGASLDPEALRTMVAARLARFKVPRHIFVVAESEIPTTASGRAQKFLLTEKAMQMLASS